MAVLPIITAPAEVLKTRAEPVTDITPELLTLLDDMLDTMYAAQGIGLAANQVGVLKRVLVMDVDYREGNRGKPMKIINPEIEWHSEELSSYDEGCLSFPGQYADVVRPAVVRVRYTDIHGKQQTIEDDGMLATCIQHEIDHLDGINFVDHISRLKRDMIMRRLTKAKRAQEEA